MLTGTYQYTAGVITSPRIPKATDIILQFSVPHAVTDSTTIPTANAFAGIVPMTPRLLGPTSSEANTNPTSIIPLRKNPVKNLQVDSIQYVGKMSGIYQYNMIA